MTDKEKIKAAVSKLRRKDPRVIAIRNMIALAKVKRIPGDNGKDGIDGLRGADGINGIDGLRGADGKHGAKGLDGLKGEIGAVGPQGEKGEAGMIWRGTYRSNTQYEIGDVVGVGGSAYVCVAATNQSPPIGFGWELLVSRGSMGVRGIKGEDGAKGEKGAKGANGATGDTGQTGATGTAGLGQYAYSASALQYDGLLTVVPKYGSPNINTNNASGVTVLNRVYFNLIHISTTVTINKILSYCGTGGGGTGNVLYGIYSVSSIGLPNTKLYESGSIAFTAAAATQVSVTGVATVLVAGWYFLAAIYSDSAGAHVYSLSTEVFPAFGQMSSVMTSRSRCIYYDDSALAYGFTLQSSYPTANMYIEKRTTTVEMPALYFEVA